MSKEQYVTFEVAKLLKEKGFNGYCHVVHINNNNSLIGKVISNSELTTTHEYKFCKDQENCITIPTQQMACRWLREEHSLFIEIMCGEEDGNIWYDYDILPVGENIPLIPENDGVITYEEPEEAIEAALEHVLKNLI